MSGFRLGALRAHYVLIVLFLIGVIAQFVLAGFGIPSLGGTDIEPHKQVGFAIHMITFLTFLISLAIWKPAKLIGLSFALAALTTLKIALPDIGGVPEKLHPANALLILALTGLIMRYDRE